MSDLVPELKPKEILQAAGVSAGMRVADLGSGAGFFVWAATQLVSPDGFVYGIEVQEQLVKALHQDSLFRGLTNVQAMHANLEIIGAVPLADDSLDFVFLVHTLCQNENHQNILAEAKRLLKTGGKILVVEWQKGAPLGAGQVCQFGVEDITELLLKMGFMDLQALHSGGAHHAYVATK